VIHGLVGEKKSESADCQKRTFASIPAMKLRLAAHSRGLTAVGKDFDALVSEDARGGLFFLSKIPANQADAVSVACV
jgi:hypothetical protein